MNILIMHLYNDFSFSASAAPAASDAGKSVASPGSAGAMKARG